MYTCKQRKLQHVHLSDDQDMGEAGGYVSRFENRHFRREAVKKQNCSGQANHRYFSVVSTRLSLMTRNVENRVYNTKRS